MKRVFILLLLFTVVRTGFAQDPLQLMQDTSAVVVKNIFTDLKDKGPAGNRIRIFQPSGMEEVLARNREINKEKKLQGYRVRIYFDNRQEARLRSSDVESHFTETYPGIPAYRTYTNPYFKVTVGDFRTKSEAIMLLKKIESEFPSAFIVRENINPSF